MAPPNNRLSGPARRQPLSLRVDSEFRWEGSRNPMDCPICGLTNPKSALRCDCGYDFASRSIKTSYLDRRSTAPEPTSPTLDPALLRHWLAEVQQGSRLVVFEYCVSFLVITLRRRSEPQIIRSGEDAAARGWRYSRISLLCGWWGIPWGPIWTIGSLMTNLRGGRDVTEALLGVSPNRVT
jgi:hypothetical protein